MIIFLLVLAIILIAFVKPNSIFVGILTSLLTYFLYQEVASDFLGLLAFVGLIFLCLIFLIGFFLLVLGFIQMSFDLMSHRKTRPKFLKILGGLILLHLFGIILYVLIWPGVLQLYLLLIAFSLFVTSSFIYSTVVHLLINKSIQPDVIVVLGCGLNNGDQLSPQLAGRIKKGVQLYHRYKGESPTLKLILSGGQGPDELISEALAMANFALAHGVPEEAVLLEAKSTSTRENLQFSKELIVADSLPLQGYIVTSDFHVLRSQILAERLGYQTVTISSFVKSRNWPKYWFRELIAVQLLNKKIWLIIGVIVFGFASWAYFC